ncbi:MAG: hypothetical protein DLM50_01645 [Candidatus Meridianibacter frigidus]|nr:MAG: hypothetical protein DLM50_01645 [Candidatus Eremiobacteraeota bacterium]
MFGLFFPLVFAAVVPVPTPAPTLPPEIGSVIARSNCNTGRRSLVAVLPVLMRNDNTIGAAVKGMGRLDSTNDPQMRLTITRTRAMSHQIFLNIDIAKDEVAKLHVLAAASTDATESQHFSAIADSLDSVVAQQTAIADQFNGFADTADMSLLYTGSEAEQKAEGATAPVENQTAQGVLNYQKEHPSLAYTNVGALTTNVYRDVQNLRGQLAQTENKTTAAVKSFVRTCQRPKRQP